RPILQLLPGGVIATAAAFGPVLAIKRHAGGGALKNQAQPFLLPGLPLPGAPPFPRQRLGHEAVGLRAVTPGREVIPAQAGRQRPHGRGQEVVEVEKRNTQHRLLAYKTMRPTTPTGMSASGMMIVPSTPVMGAAKR